MSILTPVTLRVLNSLTSRDRITTEAKTRFRMPSPGYLPEETDLASKGRWGNGVASPQAGPGSYVVITASHSRE